MARKGDAARLGAFFIQAWKEAGPGALGFTGATEEAIKEIASEKFLARRLSSPNARIVVAEEEGRIFGFASLRGLGEGRGELNGIVVLKGAEGRGIGTRLVHRACNESVRLNWKGLVVKTEVFNQRAIGFYKKNGFVETRKTTEKVGGARVPLQVLEKRLL
jgi:ribosomal protein S18 acetylase RimI-like enzyme